MGTGASCLSCAHDKELLQSLSLSDSIHKLIEKADSFYFFSFPLCGQKHRIFIIMEMEAFPSSSQDDSQSYSQFGMKSQESRPSYLGSVTSCSRHVVP